MQFCLLDFDIEQTYVQTQAIFSIAYMEENLVTETHCQLFSDRDFSLSYDNYSYSYMGYPLVI